MIRHPCAVLAAAAAGFLVAATPAAQPSPMQRSMPQMDCKAMATMPNAPMSVEQCERQMTVMNQMQQALSAPGGERPGDDQLTCEQIIAELKQVAVPGVSPEHAAQSAAAGKNLQSTYDAAIADSKATAAAGTAATAAAAAAAAVPGGNAVTGAAMYAQSAQQAALVARQKPQLDAARSRAMMANANSMADVTAMLQPNPRFAQLTQLVNAKQCSMPSN